MENLIGKLSRWMSGTTAPAEPTLDEVQVAAAALLVHAINVDDNVHPEESARLRDVLRKRFVLDDAELESLLTTAEAKEDDAIDLYRFTRILTASLDQPGRQRIIRMMWDVVAADGVIHEFEANLVWRVAELIGVSTQDRIRLRQDALNAES